MGFDYACKTSHSKTATFFISWTIFPIKEYENFTIKNLKNYEYSETFLEEQH